MAEMDPGLRREASIGGITVNLLTESEHRLSQNRLAKAVGISPNRIAEIVNNRRRITADTAVRLGLYFDTTAEFWINLQSRYNLKMARRQIKPEEADRIRVQRAA
ncbi:MAG: HigA family addiction module antitoxin [Stellaceae bacterium]